MQPSNHRPFSVLSFGAGAIGTYIGGSLALCGHRLAFVERPDVAAELRSRGLRLDRTRYKPGSPDVIPPSNFSVFSSLEEALQNGSPGGLTTAPFDVALFALKSYDTAVALETIRPFAERMPPVLCLQNGVDNEPAIATVLGAERVIHATVTSAVGRNGAGDIVLEKLRGVGVAAGHPLSERLFLAFDEAGLNPGIFPRAADMKWSKMLTNLLANPTSAILNMTAAEVFADPRLYRLEIAQLKECLAVMKAQGIAVTDLPGIPVRALAFATRLPLWLSKPLLGRAAGTGRGAKMPSFHIDLHAGRGKSEVNYLHGAVVRAGEQFHVPTPVNRLLTETLLDLTDGKVPVDEFAGKPEKLLAKLR